MDDAVVVTDLVKVYRSGLTVLVASILGFGALGMRGFLRRALD
jgi:hypothetical protein